MKEYTLKKESEGEFGYIDQDGTSWNSPSEWVWGFLGGCGCGSSEVFAGRAVKLLAYFNTPHMERKETEVNPYEDEFYELMAHWFDKEGLIEHGTSVSSSWLSKKGKQIYNVVLLNQ